MTTNNKGFTLVETLVAISLLTLVMAGTLNAVQSGLRDTTIAKDQTIAFYLIQEAMEFIKNIKDENSLKTLNGTPPANWLSTLAGPGDPCTFGKTCRIDSDLKTIVDCSGDSGGICKNLQQDSTSNLYGYTAGWPVSNFKRSIQFQSITVDEVLVIVTMSWVTRGTTKSFAVSESLFNR